MHLKGTLPPLILKVLEGGPKHGYLIAKEIKRTSKGVLDFKEGTLYPALHSQESRGLIASHEQEEDGRMRRYYRLTKEGLAELEKDTAQWKLMSSAVTEILEGA